MVSEHKSVGRDQWSERKAYHNRDAGQQHQAADMAPWQIPSQARSCTEGSPNPAALRQALGCETPKGCTASVFHRAWINALTLAQGSLASTKACTEPERNDGQAMGHDDDLTGALTVSRQ